jgi:hypothetical protein
MNISIENPSEAATLPPYNTSNTCFQAHTTIKVEGNPIQEMNVPFTQKFFSNPSEDFASDDNRQIC